VSFGLVSVPVKMFSAGESSAAISFNWLHKKDGARLKQQYICSKDGEKVENDDRVKGYEFSKGQYVLFTTDELKALEEPRGTGAIDIMEFLPSQQVDRIYVDKTYFLGPDKGGERAYKLLSEALKKTDRVALGQWAARGKQYLILVRPMEGGLAMEQLRYPEELRSFAEVPVPKTEIKKGELEMAIKVIDQSASDEFKPENYKDNVRRRILDQIQQKVEGKEITEEPTEAPKTQIIDLMEALKASLARQAPRAAAAERESAAKRRPAAADRRGAPAATRRRAQTKK